MSLEVQITIIGGGVTGCAAAYELSKNYGDNVVVIERNRQINGENQSSRNSGVIHSGIYYSKKEGPLKAKLCVEGNRMLYQFCTKYNIPHKKTGKLLVATDRLEEEYLEDIGLHQAGIRAKLKDYYDFIIERDSEYPNFINLVGIDSPGLTASLAIAKYVKELLRS